MVRVTTSQAEINEFKLDLRKFIEKAGINAEVVVRKIAFDLFSAIVKRTPVDTGRARASWQVGIDNADLSVAEERQRSANTASAEALRNLRKLGEFELGKDIYITNNLEYVIFLEAGSSLQAPYGMVAVSISETRNTIGIR